MTFKGIEHISSSCCCSLEGDVGIPCIGVADFVGDADKVGKLDGTVRSRGGASGGGGRAGLQKILGSASVMVKGDPTGEVSQTNDFADVGDVGDDRSRPAEGTSDIVGDVGGDRSRPAEDTSDNVGDVGGSGSMTPKDNVGDVGGARSSPDKGKEGNIGDVGGSGSMTPKDKSIIWPSFVGNVGDDEPSFSSAVGGARLIFEAAGVTDSESDEPEDSSEEESEREVGVGSRETALANS